MKNSWGAIPHYFYNPIFWVWRYHIMSLDEDYEGYKRIWDMEEEWEDVEEEYD